MSRSVITATVAGILLLQLSVFVMIASAQDGCLNGATKSIRFKPVGEPGIASSIDSEGNRVFFDVGNAVPIIVVQIMSRSPITGALEVDRGIDGVTIEVSADPVLYLSGNLVEVQRGEAVFRSLKVEEDLDPSQLGGYTLTFTATGLQSTNELTTGNLQQLDAGTASAFFRVRLANYGFLRDGHVSAMIPTSVRMPTVYVEALNPVGGKFGGTFTVEVEAVPSTAGSVSPAGPQASTGGVAALSNLIFTPSSPTVKEITLRFRGNGGGAPVEFDVGPLQVQYNRTRNQHIEFDSSISFFKTNNLDNLRYLVESTNYGASKGVPMPLIRILAHDGFYDPDTSLSGLPIYATTAEGELVNNGAQFEFGVAEFSRLMFRDPTARIATITFTCGHRPGVPLSGAVLYSGPVDVNDAPVKANSLAFGTASSIQADQPFRVESSAQRATIPRIEIHVLDAAGRIDTSVTGKTIQAIIQGTESLDPPSATVTNGIAIFAFATLSLSSNSDRVVLVFNFEGLNLYGAPVVILDRIDVNAELQTCVSSTCQMSLAFGPSPISHVWYPGQPLFVNAGQEIPQIRVRVLDPLGRIASGLDSASAPQMVAMTGVDPGAETVLVTQNGRNRGVWVEGEFVFACLQVGAVPAGVYRITFRALQPDGRNPFVGLSDLHTGFVDVVAVPTPAYGIRFATDESLLTREGQPSSAVLNVKLPPIAIELVDSVYRLDDAPHEAIYIDVTTSSGALEQEGAVAKIENGVAIFRDLAFLEEGRDPILTFTARYNGLPVSGSTLQSGVFFVTRAVVSSFELSLVPQLNGYTNVTHEYEELDMSSNEPLLVSMVIRDSAHQVQPAAEGRVSVRVIAQGAQIISTLADVRSGQPPFINLSIPFRDQNNYAASDAVFYTITVETASSSPLLIGKSLTVGPVRVDGQTKLECGNRRELPLVVMELKMGYLTYLQQRTLVYDFVAELVGVGVERVILTNPRPAQGVDPLSFGIWEGVKVDVGFAKATTAGERNPRTLADELLSKRPTCIKSICVASVFDKSNDEFCKSGEFINAWQNEAKTCAATQPLCRCYVDKLIGTTNGRICALEPTLQPQMLEICQIVTDCQQPIITAICKNILAESETSYVWLWILLGCLGFIGITVAVLIKQGYIFKRKRLNVRTTVDRMK